MPKTISGIVEGAGLKTDRIVLEITEGGVLKDFRLSLDILTRLRLKDFSLSIDDFGTGYANMKILKQRPFSELKVDRAFVCGASDDPTSRAILESSVQLSQSLGLNVVAEGVESQNDWDLVQRMGCQEAQGYFIARPMAAECLLQWR